MSKIVDEPKNKFPLFAKVRERLEYRALRGDRGIGEARGVELDLLKTIARGDDCRAIRYIHCEGKAEVC